MPSASAKEGTRMKCAVQRLLAFVSLVALIGASAVPLANAQPLTDETFTVSATWLAEHGKDPTVAVVDMRPLDAYNHGHIPGAFNLPWQNLAQPSSDESQIGPWQIQMMDQIGAVGISPGNMVVSYDDAGNLLAARMRWVLKYLGHEQVAVLDGGLPAWTQLGEPVTTEAITRPPVTYTSSPNPELLATWQYVLDNLDNPAIQILDARPTGSYTGEAAGTDLHAGHIPGALNLDWNNVVQADAPRTFKSADELQAVFDATGLSRDKEIIVYCGSGPASSEVLLTLQMLSYPNVREYSSSWSEWGNREDLPFVTGPEPGG
jgi:thiosulfate/3-mercaptopyruvate sulfurtransferase